MQQPYYNQGYPNGNPNYNPYNGAGRAPARQQDYFFRYQQLVFHRKNQDRAAIKKLAGYTGLAVISYLIVQEILVAILSLTGLSELYSGNEYFQTGLQIIFVLISILPCFVFFGKKMQKVTGFERPVNLNPPNNKLNTLLAVFAGLGICMVANYVTGIFTSIMMSLGYELSTPEVAMPEGPVGIALTVVQIVLCAAVVEELSLRGHVMGNLRKYGDKFAILASSLIFALMHGNLIQTPFALIAGFGLGYLTVKTNSLWTGILVHAANNLFSVTLSYLGDYMDEETFYSLYTVLFFSIAVAGGICLHFFTKRTREYPLYTSDSPLTEKQKIGAFLATPAIIVVIVLMTLTTLAYVAPIE